MRTERLAGVGDLALSTGEVVATAAAYVVTVSHPHDAYPYEQVQAVVIVSESIVVSFDLGARLTLRLEDGRYVDLLVCGDLGDGPDVLVISGLRSKA